MVPSFNFTILIHYSEIGLKKNNRSFFEKKFIENITEHIYKLKYSKIRLISARILIENVNLADWEEYKLRLKSVMGLSNATLMISTKSEIEEIKQAIGFFIKDNIFSSFRVTTKRHDKEFKKTSIETNIEIGDYIQSKN